MMSYVLSSFFCSVLYIVCSVNVYIYEIRKKSLKKTTTKTLLFPANTKYLYNICTMSAQFLRHWINIVQMLY